jgi:hypothetical protein
MVQQGNLCPEDIEALQLVRSAAMVALDGGTLAGQFRERVREAVVRTTQIIQREAARVRQS